MPNIRKCRLCGREVDFSEPWCDHETMEESAWIDIQSRMTENEIRRAGNSLQNLIKSDDKSK